MPRRTFRTALKGQVYAVEWPEWHADCAHPDCEEHTVIALLGEAHNIADAEGCATQTAPMWSKFGGFWYCPKHKTAKSK